MTAWAIVRRLFLERSHRHSALRIQGLSADGRALNEWQEGTSARRNLVGPNFVTLLEAGRRNRPSSISQTRCADGKCRSWCRMALFATSSRLTSGMITSGGRERRTQAWLTASVGRWPPPAVLLPYRPDAEAHLVARGKTKRLREVGRRPRILRKQVP